MNDIVIDVELYIIPQECFANFKLPMNDLKDKLSFLCGTQYVLNKVRIVDCKSKYGIVLQEDENILLLNNLLIKINALNDNKKEKFLQLLAINEDKSFITLLTLYHDIDNYEIIPTKNYKNENELFQVIGGLFLLSLAPDVAITLDGDNLLTNEYKETCFWTSIKSGYVKFKNGSFYVPNYEILKRPTNIDYELIEEIENYL